MGVASRAGFVAHAMTSHRGRVSLVDKLRATPAMIADVFAGRWSGVSRLRIGASLLGIAYVISPLDVIPELLLGPFGLADDLALAALAVASLFNAAEQWLDDQAGQPAGQSSFDDGDGDVVEGVVLDRH